MRQIVRALFQRRKQNAPSTPASNSPKPVPITDMHTIAGTARRCIEEFLFHMLGECEIAYDFYREWNGGWRVRTEISGSTTGRLDFVLFTTPQGGMLALPHPFPESWRVQHGVAASDGSIWTLSDDGDVVPFFPSPPV